MPRNVAVQCGAKCYLLKGSVSDELLLAVRAAYRGAAYFSPAISDSIVASDALPKKSLWLPVARTR